MKSVLLRAPVLSKSGYGEHSRQILRYLLEKNINVSIQALNWGITPWYLNDSDCDGLIGKALQLCDYQEDKRYDVSIQCQLPNEWDTTLAKTNIGVTAGVETTFANPTWASLHVAKMDKVIVPSNFTKKSLLKKAYVDTEVDVVPESYFSEVVKEPTDDIFKNDLDTDFNFLTVGVLTGMSAGTDRKNLFYLIKWFIEEFKNDSNVGLVVKTNRGRDTAIDKVGTERLLTEVLRELNHNGTPKVYLLHGQMTREEMTNVYKDEKIKGYLTATRGEGFGLPILEAATAGLPVIGTNWSAHTEFMDLGEWSAVDFDLEEVDTQKIDGNIFIEGTKWAFPKEKDFKQSMRNVYKDNKTYKDKARKLSSILAKKYSTKEINKRYDEVLEGILS
jgi:glycosyltransferase involved in cell wall biosynthesis